MMPTMIGRWIAPLLALITLAAPSVAMGHTLVDSSSTHLELNGLARGTLLSETGEAVEHGSEVLSLYVLRGGLKLGLWNRLGFGVLGEQATAGHRLLDAYTKVSLGSGWAIKLGRFKTPVSTEFLLPYGDMVLLERALLVDIAHRRASGVLVSRALEPAQHALSLEVGLFAVDGYIPGLAPSSVAVVRALYEAHPGLELHLSAAQPIPLTALSEAPAEPSPQQIDAALLGEHGHWETHAEVLVSHLPGESLSEGVALTVDRRFDGAGSRPQLDLEGAYDLLYHQAHLTQRATAALDASWMAHHIVSRLQYAATLEDHVVAHGVGVELQLEI